MYTNKYLRLLLGVIQHYNHKKYWHRRELVVNPFYKNKVLKLYYLLYLKYIDAHHNSSFGTNYNYGSKWITPPLLPHGPNGIIVGHDTIIGANCTIFQQVTIAHGLVKIGDNVLIGAGAKILPNVCIGNNVKIGANCVVVENVPDNCTVVMPKLRILFNSMK